MSYTKHTWIARLGTGLSKFTDQISGTLFDLQSTPDTVTQPGTPFSAAWMNDMEDGIYNANTLVGAGSPSTSTVGVVGQHYLDSSAGVLWVCTFAAGGAFNWTCAMGLLPQITVNAPSGSTVTVSGQGVNLSATAYDDKAVFTVPSYGSYSAQAVSGGQSSQSVTVKITSCAQYSVTPHFTGISFAQSSWENIISICDAGILSQTAWSIGNTHSMLIGDSTVSVEIIGIGHDDLNSGGRAPLTLAVTAPYGGTKWSSGTSTAGGWGASAIREYALGLLNLFPEPVRDGVKIVTKSTVSGGGASSITTTTDRVFVPSVSELLGTGSEGTQYARYTSALPDGEYWTRSPVAGSGVAGYAHNINSGGTSARQPVNTTDALVFAFCL